MTNEPEQTEPAEPPGESAPSPAEPAESIPDSGPPASQPVPPSAPAEPPATAAPTARDEPPATAAPTARDEPPATAAPTARDEPPREGEAREGSRDRDRDRDRGPRDGGRDGGRRGGFRRRGCEFCIGKTDVLDYKDVDRLRRYVSDRGKMEPRRKVGTCARHQRIVSRAVKRARYIALLPYTAEHVRQTGVPAGGRR